MRKILCAALALLLALPLTAGAASDVTPPPCHKRWGLAVSWSQSLADCLLTLADRGRFVNSQK